MSSLAKNYNRRKISFKKGKGSFLYASNGKKYLDFVQGIAVNSLGHSNQNLINAVKKHYAGFTNEQISAEIAQIVYPEDIDWHGEVEVNYQTVENLNESINAAESGDWYFTGNYPTAGGISVANQAFMDWREGKSGRSYDLAL